MKLRIPTKCDYNMSYTGAASIDNLLTILEDGSIKLIKRFSTLSTITIDDKCHLDGAQAIARVPDLESHSYNRSQVSGLT